MSIDQKNSATTPTRGRPRAGRRWLTIEQRVADALPRHKAANGVGPGRTRKSTRPGAGIVFELSPFEFLDRLADLVPPLSARFGYASASGQGRSLGRSTLVIDAGSIHGGRSVSHASRFRKRSARTLTSRRTFTCRLELLCGRGSRASRFRPTARALLAESGYHLSSCRATGDLDRPAASSRIGGLQPLDKSGTSVRRPFPCGIHDRVDVFCRWPNQGLSAAHNHKPARRLRAAELSSGKYGRPRSSRGPGRVEMIQLSVSRNSHMPTVGSWPANASQCPTGRHWLGNPR